MQGTNAHVILEVSPGNLAPAGCCQAALFRTLAPGQLHRARHWFSPPSHPVLARAFGALGQQLCRLQGSLQHAMLAFLGDGSCLTGAAVAAEVSVPCEAAG